MAPQPLSSITIKGPVNFGQNNLSDRPELGRHVLAVLGHWAIIDGSLARFLALMLKADVQTGIAMYQALVSSEARRAALRAAAMETLDDDDLALFNAVMRSIRASRVRRNEFAHHIWGSCTDLPSALLLADPKVLSDVFIEFDTHKRTPNTGAFRAKSFDRTKVYVFKEPDLHNDANDALRASRYVNTLVSVLSGTKEADAWRQWLLSEPRVQQELEKESNEKRK